jgi:hypothetical protein
MAEFLTNVKFLNNGVRIKDTNGTHYLTITVGSDISADRTLTLITGDANRALTLTGDASIQGTNTGDQSASSLGLGTGDSPQFAGINVGHASDTTITRISAGVIAVEGSTVLLSGGALGTPSSGNLAHCSGLSLATGVTDDLPTSSIPAYWVEIPLTAPGVAVAAGAKVAMVTHMANGTITGFKAVCDPANEPSATAIQVDMNSVNLGNGTVTSRLSAVASISTGANLGNGTISGTQTVTIGDQSSFDIDQGSDGKELRALFQFTPS